MPRKRFRVALLLAVLALCAWVLFTARPPPPPDWDQPLHVVVYPYNADSSKRVDAYIRELVLADFLPIADFMAAQARPYELPVERPFTIALGRPVDHAPTSPPETRGWAARIHWGLSLRWWHFRFRDVVNRPDIIVVARYHDRDALPERLHSIGIAAQRLAVAKLVAGEQSTAHNNVVLAHEILHTVGASDLYDPATGHPLYPEGYADPDQNPLHPQQRAEIMAGQVPISPFRAVEPGNLDRTVIGRRTAIEIGWPP